MEITMPVLPRNARIADATPRRSNGTAAIIALVFGGWKSPLPVHKNPDRENPVRRVVLHQSKPAQPNQRDYEPPGTDQQEPYLSERFPPIGPEMMSPIARGAIRMLAVSGS